MIEIGYIDAHGNWSSVAGPYAAMEDAQAAFERDWEHNAAAHYEIRETA